MPNYIKKIRNWLQVLFETRTTEGFFLEFQIKYIAQSSTSLLAIFSRKLANRIRAFVQSHSAGEFIINNPIGLFAVNAKNDSLTKSITSFEHNHHHWLAEATHKNIFIDIGANIGFYSLLATTKFGYDTAHTFEPNPETYHRLQKNVTLNNLQDRVSVHTYGLAATNSGAVLNAKPVHTGGSSMVANKQYSDDISSFSVPTKTFDHFINELNLNVSDISFIKIDVEGYEHEVLEGMKETLPKLSVGTCIFIEIHPHAPSAKETKALIEKYDFTCVKSSPQYNFLYKKVVSN